MVSLMAVIFLFFFFFASDSWSFWEDPPSPRPSSLEPVGAACWFFCLSSVSREIYPEGIVTGPELLMWSL